MIENKVVYIKKIAFFIVENLTNMLLMLENYFLHYYKT